MVCRAGGVFDEHALRNRIEIRKTVFKYTALLLYTHECGVMPDLRLGDVIDDYCVKCRRLTNHSIVSLMSGAAAKVRCRTCYSDHDFRNEQVPPTKKELARQKELYNAVLAGVAPPTAVEPATEPAIEPVVEPIVEPIVEKMTGGAPEAPAAEAAAAAPKKKKK